MTLEKRLRTEKFSYDQYILLMKGTMPNVGFIQYGTVCRNFWINYLKLKYFWETRTMNTFYRLPFSSTWSSWSLPFKRICWGPDSIRIPPLLSKTKSYGFYRPKWKSVTYLQFSSLFCYENVSINKSRGQIFNEKCGNSTSIIKFGLIFQILIPLLD